MANPDPPTQESSTRNVIENAHALLGMYGSQQPPPPYPQGYAQGMPMQTMPQNGISHPVPFTPGQGARYPNPAPLHDPNCPAATMINSTGGVGCEPGYNMFFAPEYTKIHILKSDTAPWNIPPGMEMRFGAFQVPCNTLLVDIFKGFGAINPKARKNRITEVLSGHSGKWYKGMTVTGEDKEMMEKTIKEIGWDGSRTGRAYEKPVVYLWITNT